MLTLFLASMLMQIPAAKQAEYEQLNIEQDLIQALQTHFLKKVGCFRYVKDPQYITSELTKEDCGKPQEIDIAVWSRAEKLAKKLFKLEGTK